MNATISKNAVIIENTTSVSETISESCITLNEVDSKIVDEQVGGPSLVINDVPIPRMMKATPTSYTLVTNPQFEFHFKVGNKYYNKNLV